MSLPSPSPMRLHLRAAVIALLATTIIGWWELSRVRHVEQRFLPIAAPENSKLKDLGVVWQREDMTHPNVLPLYGSSELIKRAPNKASKFFETYPSGFVVSPIGRPSCTSLILLEKLAAAGPQPAGRKVAISVSPSWFLEKGANHYGFGGNFSTMQASELFFSTPLSLPLKQKIARRMLRYPEVFDKSPVLGAAVRGLASERLRDNLVYYAALPLGQLQNAIFRLQDHFEVFQYLRDDHKIGRAPHAREMPLDWDQLLADARPLVNPLPADLSDDERLRQFPDDGAFLHALHRSYEWGDFELMLRVARELHFEPLLLSMPLEDAHFERMGISRQTIDAYAARLREFADRYQVPVVDFADLGNDPEFFADHYGHPSAKGWIYFDRALDDFFHDRPVRTEAIPAGSKPARNTSSDQSLSE